MSMALAAVPQGGRILRLLAVPATLLCLDGVAANRGPVRFNATGTEHDDSQGYSLLQGVSNQWGMVKSAFNRLLSGDGNSNSEEVFRQEHERRLAKLREDLNQLGALETAHGQLQSVRKRVDRNNEAVISKSQAALMQQGVSPILGPEQQTPPIVPQSSPVAPTQVMYGLQPAREYNPQRLQAIQTLGQKELQRPAPGTGTACQQFKEMMLDVGGGTGATISGAGTMLDQVLLRRMRYQDKAVMLLLLLVYIGALMLTALLTYKQASNNSSVTFYADPRYSNSVMTGARIESFLTSFTGPPANVQLQVSGLMPLPPFPDFLSESVIEWMGSRYRVDFAFALDLAPWLVAQPWEGDAEPADSDGEDNSVGVNPEDIREMEKMLASNTNDLACVEVIKNIEWEGWEELSTNIKTKIRQAGYTGIIHVRHTKEESVLLHKNKQWANFMHSRMTKVLCALSVVGWIIYQPYMWVRHRSQIVRCKFRVGCPIDQYWELIWDKIGPQGFSGAVAGGLPPVAPVRTGNQSWTTARFAD